VTDSEEQLIGYDVEYTIGGEAYEARLEQAPEGDRVPLQNGEPQWQAATGSGSASS
jgi:uncharacterized protein YcfJ